MTTERIPQQPTPASGLWDRLERELARLREKRPALLKRISRAENLLVTHFACPRQRVIRARCREGRVRFLVKGSGGAVYAVEPETWGCSCPDAHRRGKGCKHALAVYVMVRASKPAPKPLTCATCGESFPRRVMVEVTESLTFHEGDLLCKPCSIDSDAEVL